MLFLVACVYNDGVNAESFRVVEPPSRLAVAAHIVDSPDIWNKFLHDTGLYDPIIRGDRPYYADPCPVTAEEALRLIDRSSVDGDSRARLSIHPISNILTLPLSARQRDDESRLAEALLADIDPDAEPEREAAECRAATEEGLLDVETGGNTMTLEEARRRWGAK
jgi:hypothetical protein